MGSSNRSFIELKVQNNQRNKLFERAWPLRLVAPLSAQALLKSMCCFGAKTWLGWKFPNLFKKLTQDV